MIWGVCKQRKSPLATPGDLAMDKMADFFFNEVVGNPTYHVFLTLVAPSCLTRPACWGHIAWCQCNVAIVARHYDGAQQ